MTATPPVDRAAASRLSRRVGGAGGATPGDTGHSDRPGPVVQVGHCCREVKRDGTAGLVGCWIKRRRRRHPPAGEFGRMP
jgi:hypothetical protein